MSRYNIVSDGTTKNITPLITGFHLKDFPKGQSNETFFVDQYPFIWDDYKKAGYVTGYMEDTPLIPIFKIFKVGNKTTTYDSSSRSCHINGVLFFLLF